MFVVCSWAVKIGAALLGGVGLALNLRRAGPGVPAHAARLKGTRNPAATEETSVTAGDPH
jgi:hypothetical protein